MELLISELLSSAIQLVLFSMLPLIWWFVTARKKESFFAWIGLKKVKGIAIWKLFLLIVTMVAVFWMIDEYSLSLMNDTETAASMFQDMGIKAVPAVLVYAVFHTSLSEEILFRGFLLKRLGTKFNFVLGNIIQASLFGLLHGLEFFSAAGIISAAILVLITGTASFVDGYINEKKAGGSILPSWSIHAITNLIAGLVSAL